MKTINGRRVFSARPAAQQRKLQALWKRLENDEKRTQATRNAINKLLQAERVKLMPASTDD